MGSNPATIGYVPNAPKTPHRTIRIPESLWSAAMSKARSQGVSLTSVIIKALERYVKAK